MGSSEPAPPSLLGPKARPWIGGLLVILGVQCWLVLGQGEYGLRTQRWLLLTALGVSFLPPVQRGVAALRQAIRNPSTSSRFLTAFIISAIAACYLPFTAWMQDRDFVPIWQDAQSYAIQVKMLSQGRLWMPAHPLADFFDTFQMIVKPVYASMYFPGASIFYVPAAWVGIPYWVISSAISGTCVGLMYWIVTDLIDGAAGILAALMLAALEQFRHISIMLLGHPAILLLGLLMIVFWLEWRREKSWRWAIALGFASGWAAITRPMDAMIIALPIGVDMLLELRTERRSAWLTTIAAIMLAAAPFFAMQMIFNIGVTGSFSQTPFGLHADLYYPDTSLGFHPFDPAHRPQSVIPQKQAFHDEWTIPAIKRHQPGNILRNWLDEDLNTLTRFTLPHPWFTLLLPAGVVGLTCRRRIVVVFAVPLWIVLYSFYTFFLPHYVLIIAPAMIVLALLGAQQLENFWPRACPFIRTFLTLAIVILSLTQMREFNRLIRDQQMNARELRTISTRLNSPAVHTPAVVLFRFPPGGPPAIEPVYNTDVAWPDDARIIRAHDLGARNTEIFDYYAKLQPERSFYVYDRGNGSLTFLGLAKDLGHAD